MKLLRIGLIGAGGIGRFWSDALLESRSVQLCAVADKDTDRAAEIARVHGACSISAHPEALFSDPKIDAIIIATPHAFLAPLTKKALQSGKHVLCEKPAGIASKEIAQNVALAKKKKLIYMVGFNHRFHPAYEKAKAFCDDGKIGELLSIRARYGFRGRPGYEKEWRFNKKIAGGGELLDQGMHLLDLGRWFLGDFKEVKGYVPNLYWGGGVEDNAYVLAKTKTGQIATLHASWTELDWTHCFEIFGEKGYLKIEGLDQRYGGPERLTMILGNRRTGKIEKPNVTVYKNEKKEDSFVREMAQFHRAILKKGKHYPSGTDAVAALTAVEAIYRTHKK